jgi:hypothetical protein
MTAATFDSFETFLGYCGWLERILINESAELESLTLDSTRASKNSPSGGGAFSGCSWAQLAGFVG